LNFDILLSVFWVWDMEGLMTQGVTPSKGKRLFSELTPRNNMSAKKIILLLIGHTKYTKHIRFYLPVPPSVTVFILTVSAFMFCTHTHIHTHTHTSNIPNFCNAIPQHIIISPIHCIAYTAPNTSRCHSWRVALPCCCDPLGL